MTSYYDAIRLSRAYGARSPCSHYDVCLGARSSRSHYNVILIMTSFASELAMPSVTDERTYVTYGHLTAFSI